MVVDIQLGWKRRLLASIKRASVRFDEKRGTLMLRLNIKPGTLERLPGDMIMNDLRVILIHENSVERLVCRADWIDREGVQFTASLHLMEGRMDSHYIAPPASLGLTNIETISLVFSDHFEDFPNFWHALAFMTPHGLPRRDDDSSF